MKDFSFSKVEHFRCERKFYLDTLSIHQIELMLKSHPAIFSEIYYERIVNNIYFDSFGMEQYFDNINGVPKRLKVRIRWYGNLFGRVEGPILELKVKHNLHIGKLQYPLKSFILDKNFSISTAQELFREADIQDILKLHLLELNFSLLNSYTRRYFLSADRKYRITLDYNMHSYQLSPYQNTFMKKVKNEHGIILELKYNKSNDEFADRIANFFPFRMTRISKYVTGVANLFPA